MHNRIGAGGNHERPWTIAGPGTVNETTLPGLRRDVKRLTAVGHLVETGKVSSEQTRFRGTDIGWPVEELWVAGDLLGLADSAESGTLVVVLDEPPEVTSWLATNPAGEWAGSNLRPGKRPFAWCYRPLAWPVWNHRYRRLARYWSAQDGLGELTT
jgi:hypothetical protein